MRIIPIFTLFCGVCLLSSCSKRDRGLVSTSDPFPASDATNVVAKVNGVPIDLERFQQALSRGNARMSKNAALEELLRHEALVAQAKAAGYDRDPEVIAAFERMIASRFQERELAKRTGAETQVSDAEVEAAYQRDIGKYTAPASVRAGVIYIAASAKGAPEKQAELRERADQILARAREVDGSVYSQLVQQYSEDQATRYRNGDAGWLNQSDLDSRWESAVVQAAFALKNSGEVAPLIATSRGFYIVRLAETRSSTVRPISEVRDGIKYQLGKARQHRLKAEFFDQVRRGSTVEINQSLLDSLPEPTNRAARQPPSLPGG